MPDSDFETHPFVSALTETIRSLTCLYESGVKKVAVDEQVWRDFCAAPKGPPAPPRTATAAAMPQVPEPGTVGQNRRLAGPSDTPQQRQQVLEMLRAESAQCRACLYAEHLRVCGRGNAYNPTLAIVCGPALEGDSREAIGARLEPGSEAWKLLEKMLAAIQLPLEAQYLTPVLKCAVGRGRVDGVALKACSESLRRELKAVNPRAVVLLGAVAAQALFPNSAASVGSVGQWNFIRDLHLRTITLHHPMRMLLLGNQMARELKLENWAALQALRDHLAAGR